MECALCKVQYVGKDVNNPKSIPADSYFRKPGHLFSLRLHAKFTIIEQLSNIHITDKDTIKFQLKRREDFWIQKHERLTPEGLNQELNNV